MIKMAPNILLPKSNWLYNYIKNLYWIYGVTENK